MNYKKITIYSIIIAAFVTLLSTTAFAATLSEMATSLITLKFLETVGIKLNLSPLDGLIRFCLIFTFAFVFNALLSKIPFLKGPSSIVIATTVSIIGVFFIPTQILFGWAVGLGVAFSLILLVALVAPGAAAYVFLKEQHFLRAIVLFLVIIVLGVMTAALGDGEISASDDMLRMIADITPRPAGLEDAFKNVNTVVGAALIINIFLLIHALFKGFSSTGVDPSEQGKGWLSTVVDRGIQHSDTGGFTVKGRKLQHARREKFLLLKEIHDEKAVLKELQATKDITEEFRTSIATLITGDSSEIITKEHFKIIESRANDLEKDLKDVIRAENRWKKTNRRQTKEVKKLIKEFIEQERTGSEIRDLQALEDNLLNGFIKIERNIEAARKNEKKFMAEYGKFKTAIETIFNRIKNNKPIYRKENEENKFNENDLKQISLIQDYYSKNKQIFDASDAKTQLENILSEINEFLNGKGTEPKGLNKAIEIEEKEVLHATIGIHNFLKDHWIIK